MKRLLSRLLLLSVFIALPAQAGDVIKLAPGGSAIFSLQENVDDRLFLAHRSGREP